MASFQQVWPEGRPACPNTKDWSCYGSLGWTLQQALDEMDESQVDAPPKHNSDGKKEEDGMQTGDESFAVPRDDDTGKSSREEVEEDKPALLVRTKIKATTEMRQAILEALTAGRMKKAPHGIIKGRVKYYQRQGSRWRMEVDDVRIRRRVPLAKIRRKRKTERPSLWDLSRESRQGKEDPVQTGNDKDDAERRKWSFELLAYNDIE
eukprot:scaffold34597_cov177-Amphora_coffeaeformis.AAC.7